MYFPGKPAPGVIKVNKIDPVYARMMRDCHLLLPLWEGVDDTAYDASGYGRNGTMTNHTDNPWVATPYGNGLTFDQANNEHLSMGAGFTAAPTTLSAACLVMSSGDAVDNTFFSRVISGSAVQWHLQTEVAGNDRFQFDLETSVAGYRAEDAAFNYTNGQFYLVAGTWDGSTIRLYIDGALAGSTATSGTINSSSSNMYLGRGHGTATSHSHDGEIAFAGYWERCLSADEIGALVHDPFGFWRPITAKHFIMVQGGVDREMASDMTATSDIAAALGSVRPIASDMTATADLAVFMTPEIPMAVDVQCPQVVTMDLAADRPIAADLLSTVDLGFDPDFDRGVRIDLTATADIGMDLTAEVAKYFASDMTATADLGADVHADRPVAVDWAITSDLTTELNTNTAFASDMTVTADLGANIIKGSNVAAEVTRNGITWHFDTSYEVGQYVMGDWWVKENTPGAGVVVTHTTPTMVYNPSNYNDLRNGSVIEVMPDDGTCYDGRAYLAAERDDNDNPIPIFPVTLYDTQVMLTSESQATLGETDYTGNSYSNTVLRTVEALTCVASNPPSGSFRPPYVNGTKTFGGQVTPIDKSLFAKTTADINWSKVPNLTAVAGAPEDDDPAGLLNRVDWCTRMIERPQILHHAGFLGRYHHPVNQMRDYHQRLIRNYCDALCTACQDNGVDKTTLVYALVQTGIDVGGLLAAVDGHRVTSGFDNGQSHGDGQIKSYLDSSLPAFIPIFVGHILDDPYITSLCASYTSARGYQHVYHIPTEAGTTYNPGGPLPPVGVWTGHSSNLAYVHDGESKHEHEHLHPNDWWTTTEGEANNLLKSGQFGEGYRRTNTRNWTPFFTVLKIIGHEDKYTPRSTTILNYVQRWLDEGTSGDAAVVANAANDDGRDNNSNPVTHANATYGGAGGSTKGEMMSNFVDTYWDYGASPAVNLATSMTATVDLSAAYNVDPAFAANLTAVQVSGLDFTVDRPIATDLTATADITNDLITDTTKTLAVDMTATVDLAAALLKEKLIAVNLSVTADLGAAIDRDALVKADTTHTSDILVKLVVSAGFVADIEDVWTVPGGGDTWTVPTS